MWSPSNPAQVCGSSSCATIPASGCSEGGWRTWQWPWHIDLTPGQVGRLFGTFSDWSPHEVDAVVAAAAQVGPVVREHYVTILHVLRRV